MRVSHLLVVNYQWMVVIDGFVVSRRPVVPVRDWCASAVISTGRRDL